MALRRIFSFLLSFGIYCQHQLDVLGGTLYPRDTETRQVKTLDGIWNFRTSSASDSLKGHWELWFTKELRRTGSIRQMVVPSSYNDITLDKNIRDHVGIVWYDKVFFVPLSWQYEGKVWLRFGSVCYAAQVWVNGILVIAHEIGHLPFEVEITDQLQYGGENLITVAVDNTLLDSTVPQGVLSMIQMGNSSILKQTYTFDFFNYAGIDRSVQLYTTPKLYISDVTVVTNIIKSIGIVNYNIEFAGGNNSVVSCEVSLIDKNDQIVAVSSDCRGNLTVKHPILWWPFLMHTEPGYLYTLKVKITDGETVDIYRLKVGIRVINWTRTQLLINDKPIYIRGVGKHEDSDIKGKGLDLAVVLKDFELLKWLGVNAFRTSHYPYAEEIMDLADEMGIMVIDECPSVDTDVFSDTLLAKHRNSLTELISRDKNRPSVIMWSVANEPRTQKMDSQPYFRNIISHVKSLDTTRPVTIVLSSHVKKDMTAQYVDIISFNRYNAWYTNPGVTETIYPNVINEATAWFEEFHRPVLMSEYGADTYPGFHSYPESIWSEEYQSVVLEEHFKAFDYLRKKGFFIGEMVWNFADFKTSQMITRVGGNKKGIFTRQREPKAAAFLLRARYNELANKLDGVPLPEDSYRYFHSNNCFLNVNPL